MEAKPHVKQGLVDAEVLSLPSSTFWWQNHRTAPWGDYIHVETQSSDWITTENDFGVHGGRTSCNEGLMEAELISTLSSVVLWWQNHKATPTVKWFRGTWRQNLMQWRAGRAEHISLLSSIGSWWQNHRTTPTVDKIIWDRNPVTVHKRTFGYMEEKTSCNELAVQVQSLPSFIVSWWNQTTRQTHQYTKSCGITSPMATKVFFGEGRQEQFFHRFFI